MGFFRKRYEVLSDEKLMVLLDKGDQSAFGEIYQRYAVKMHRFFYRMLRQDEELSRDQTQDLFLHILERPHLFDARRKFSTWIYSVASNRCKNIYRSWGRKKPTINLEEKDIVDGAITPEEKLDHSFFNGALQEAIDLLPDAQRACFVLRYQEELSIKEIGEIIDCPTGTVKSRLHYSLKQLAKDLHQFNPKNSSHEK